MTAASQARRGTSVEHWFVYVARCADGSIYTGIAKDVDARIAAHNAGKGARYTKGRGPLVVLAMRRCPSKGAALRLELAVKALSKDQKEQLAGRGRLARFARTLV